MPDDVTLHTVEPIVTPDRSEYGVNRIRLPGGWGYWLSPGGVVVSFFVPDPVTGSEVAPLLPLGNDQPIAALPDPAQTSETDGAS